MHFASATAPTANFAGLGTPFFTQDFEGATFPPTGWTVNNVDGGGNTWVSSIAQNHTDAGTKSAAHLYHATQTENDYLITSQITSLPANSVLTFWSYNVYPTYYVKSSVLVSTTGVLPANFTEVWTTASVSESWVQNVVDLTAYAGQNIYIAFRYEGVDANNWFLDDISIAPYNYTQITTYEGDPVYIYDKSTGVPTAWDWTLTGATPNQVATQNALTTYYTAGLYPVTLRVGNIGGANTKTVNNFVNVLGRAPIADYYAKGNLKTKLFQAFPPVGGTVSFTDKSTRAPNAWNWTITGGTPSSSTAQNTSATYTAAGTYDFSLQVSNASGNNTKSFTGGVKVGGTSYCSTLLPTDVLRTYSLTTPAGGKLPGHGYFLNSNDSKNYYFLEWADLYENSYAGQITKLDVYVSIALGAGKNVTFNVYDASNGEPGTILGSKTVLITSLTAAALNTITFDTPINVTGDFYVGYKLNYDGLTTAHTYTTHQFCPYTATSRLGDNVQYTTALFKIGTVLDGSDAYWYPLSWVYGIETSLALYPEFTYGTPPVSANFSATSTALCVGGSTSFSDLSTGSPTSWAWTFAGGTPATSTLQNPTVTYNTVGNYMVSLTVSNGSSNTKAVSGYITVSSLPVAPTSVSASLTSICSGVNSILSYTGGSGTTFKWYTGSCGGTLVGTGNNLNVSPTVTTTYYGRWENICGNSTCQTVTITVNPIAVAPTSVSATLSTICAGASTTLSYTGGLGTTFGWYTGSCGGTLVGTGNNLSVSPVTTTTYYGRWESACGNSTCQNLTITINPLPVAPTSVSATLTTICAGASTVLSYTGGSGTTFGWYTGSCGGTLVGTGNNLSVSPVVTTTYYGRWENACGNSTCQTVTITINSPVAPTSVSATLTSICPGASTTLSYTGGSGTTFGWYTGSCGGTSVGTGNNLNVSPAVTTTYYGRWENACGNSTCQTVTITVNALPATPTITAGGPTTFCSGGNVTLTSSAGTSYLWSNAATTASINVTTAGSYTVRVTNAAGCQSAASTATIVTVNALPATPTITAGGLTTFCSGGNVTLTSSAGTSYLWSNAATTSSINVTTAGSYTVQVTNAAGCQSAASAATVITVNAIPATPTITAGGPTTFCSGGNVTLTSSAGTSYLWSTGATTASISPAVSGSYTVQVTNAGGCQSLASAATVVTVNALPATPTITAGGPTDFLCCVVV